MLNSSLIKQIRLDRGLTQEQVAFELGIAQSLVCVLEYNPNHNVTIKLLEKMSKFYQLPISSLIKPNPEL